MTSSTSGFRPVPHVLDWSAASIEWTPDGFELCVPLGPAATYRQAIAMAEVMTARFEYSFRGTPIAVVPVEPDDNERTLLLITSPELLTVNPQGLRDQMNSIADTAANEVIAVETRDAAIAATWLAALRQ
jgi:hypothetical protein